MDDGTVRGLEAGWSAAFRPRAGRKPRTRTSPRLHSPVNAGGQGRETDPGARSRTASRALLLEATGMRPMRPLRRGRGCCDRPPRTNGALREERPFSSLSGSCRRPYASGWRRRGGQRLLKGLGRDHAVDKEVGQDLIELLGSLVLHAMCDPAEDV